MCKGENYTLIHIYGTFQTLFHHGEIKKEDREMRC